ncbi:MAG: PA14 domain-containing protein [Desulfobacterales bacterium]|nr:PA14 domain-containing protein [Desulfobacterales bacterium]
MSTKRLQTAAIILLLSATLLAGCASVRDGGFARPAAAPMPEMADEMKPGLAVLYFPKRFVRHVDILPQGEEALAKGVAGPPVTNLNRRFGRGEVFKSGTNRGIGMEMSGFILLDKPGRYQFQVNSNDGFRLSLDGRVLLEDPAWHPSGDQLTPPAEFVVQTPAWYSLRIRYFQRKGTAAFQFYWQPPGASEFSPVPGRVLAHLAPY